MFSEAGIKYPGFFLAPGFAQTNSKCYLSFDFPPFLDGGRDDFTKLIFPV